MYGEARELFEKRAHLCAFEAADAPDDYWRLFDLADTQLFQGNAKPALDTYSAAIDKVPVMQRGAGEIIGLLDAENSRSRTHPTRAEGALRQGSAGAELGT